MFPQIITRAAAEFDDRVAFFDPDGWTASYRDIDRLSDALAVGLARRGIRRGDVIALAVPSGVEYVVAYGALAKLGAVSAGINALLRPRERIAAIEAAQVKLAIGRLDLLDGAPDDLEVIEAVPASGVAGVFADVRVDGEAPPPIDSDPDSPVCICFTSGSTGQPKGALFRNRQLSAIMHTDTGGGAGWGVGTHTIIGTQLAHVGGQTKLPWMIAGGGALHLLKRWSATAVMELTERHRMPSLNAGPTQVALIMRSPNWGRYDLSSIKAIIAGQGASTPALIAEARERFHAGYSVRYSLTESGGVGTATALDAPDEEALYTVGRPRPGVEAKVADDDGNELPVGEIGEMWVRSACNMSEYWRMPKETAETIVDGWVRTGDLGIKDDIGCFRLAGRKKEMFVRGGYNVYPLEVEKVLTDHPKVAELAIVPRADELMGEIGVAVVVPRNPADPPTLDELRDFGGNDLAGYKLPERVRYVDELPVNSGHKIDRLLLQQQERERP